MSKIREKAMKKPRDAGILCFSVLCLGIVIVCMLHFFLRNPVYYQLGEYTAEEAAFRAMDFGEEGLSVLFSLAEESGRTPGEAAAPFMVEYEFSLADVPGGQLTPGRLKDLETAMAQVRPVELSKLAGFYNVLLEDLVYFPIAGGESDASADYSYENSWGAERTYGGERTHEGTDIMDGGNGRGFFPVVSVSDGVVEHCGWLELGGWRLGIRSPGGAYFYYAHLSGYDHEFQPGEQIRAGQLLGFMGDSGYSRTEGTIGNFAVHLHFGIYFRSDHYEELSVNPYWILRYLEDRKVKYSY